MSRILVIEDQPQSARLVKKLLQRSDHTVILAESGEDGLTSAFESHIDLILMDLGLPDIDGQTLIALLRQRPEFNTIPIIAFTAWPPDVAHSMAEAYGCDGVITKPINMTEFLATIEGFLESGNTAEAAFTPDFDLN